MISREEGDKLRAEREAHLKEAEAAMNEAELEQVKTALARAEAREALRPLLNFDERERRLIRNCRDYAHNDPAGLPGHNLMLIINKMAEALGI